MRGPLRDDLALAAYAVSLGYSLRGHLDAAIEMTPFDENGIPGDSIQFKIGDVDVWLTARGWRVGQLVLAKGGQSSLVNAVYAKPTDSDFFGKLKDALDAGARNWRDR